MKITLAIDLENDFITGTLGSPHAHAIIANCKTKIEKAIENGDFIAHSFDNHNHPMDPYKYEHTLEGRDLRVCHCVYDTPGAELHPELKELLEQNSSAITKFAHGTVKWQEFFESYNIYEEDIDEIELFGLCTGICVLQNAIILSAIYRKAKITVDASCCACVTDESHRQAIAILKLNHINVINEPEPVEEIPLVTRETVLEAIEKAIKITKSACDSYTDSDCGMTFSHYRFDNKKIKKEVVKEFNELAKHFQWYKLTEKDYKTPMYKNYDPTVIEWI